MRLIDADELLERSWRWPINSREAVQQMIRGCPAVDAVPVIRCKDCKHNQLPPTHGNADCELWCGMTDLYGYCHYGERKEE